ncbi:hypothetical protein [uncultured Methanospirillum sp.]|uniref:hypothetical protein n=1 Tax=uncultured Methanospirillum sp. TaxID=262503 RepID=UPI0029C817A3|nr:hypothetical protein [uncultured Methanospirillum sp.]
MTPAEHSRICPFISIGQDLVSCLGTRCTACRSVLTGEERLTVCALIDREFYDCWEEETHGRA